MSVAELRPPEPDARDRQLGALAGLVQLERRVRAAATPEELGFLMVNDTHTIVGYRQAVFWREDTRRVQSISGLATPDPDAPFCQWIAKLFRTRLETEQGAKPHVLNAHDLADSEREFWGEYLPGEILWLPLGREGGPVLGVLLLARDEAWSDPERNLLDYVVDSYAHAWAALTQHQHRAHDSGVRKRASILLGLLLLAVLFTPMQQSVLAPAEITPRDPAVVRAPIQGVVQQVDVKPNQPVKAGAVLAELDPRETQSKLQISRQALAVADAELRQAQELAVFDDRGRANLAVLQGRREEQAAEVTYLQSVLGRLRLTAPRAGVAIFDDASELTGKPVVLGERIMMVADPADAELEIHLAVADAIALASGDNVEFYLNADAGSPLRGTLERVGYRAGLMPDGVMAYRLKAVFPGADERIRVGLRGTAKLYGDRTVLVVYLLRRPLGVVRVWLGL